MLMPSVIHKALSKPEASWVCCHCGMPTFTDSLFDSYEIRHSNSFDVLASHPDNSIDNSIDSLEHVGPGPPMLASSPSRPPTRQRRQKTSNIRVLIVNIQSVMAKREAWLALVENSDPDIILASETWLKPHILNPEFLPGNYNTYRCDRPDGYGGVLLAAKTNMISEEIPISRDLGLEMSCVKISIQGNKSLVICSVYRPTNRDIDYCEKLCKEIKRICKAYHQSTIWIGGDFNLPDIDWTSDSIAGNNYPIKINECILETINETALSQIVDFPTRGENTLDIFMTNRPSLVNRCEAVPGISDHDTAVFIDTDIIAKRQKTESRKVYLWKKGDFEQLHKEVEEFSENYVNTMSTNDPIDVLWDMIHSKLIAVMDKYIPSKMKSPRFDQPWINRNIKRLANLKKKYFTRARDTNLKEDWAKYKELKKETQKKCKEAFSNYISTVICETDESRQTNKKFWSYVKSLKRDSTGVAPLKKEGITFSDSKNKAEILNQQFASVFTRDENVTDNYYTTDTKFPKMPDIKVGIEGVRKLLQGLNPNKAAGPDSLPSKLLKNVADQLAPALRLLFQASLNQQQIPTQWKQALVTPIFKKGDKSRAANYRPVSLTSICCKIQEHIIHHSVMKHLDKHHILNDTQHGFRKKRSCETQLVLTVQDLAKGLDDNKQIDAVLLDFSKAFDKVSHRLLQQKLHHYGIRGHTLGWIKSFLGGRSQRVVCEGIQSSECEVASGVPQGTVLGPLLFLLYINDMPEVVKSTTRLFADDALVYRVIECDKDASNLQKDLDSLQDWERKWKMEFNPDKCEVLRITLKKNIIPARYSIHGKQLQIVNKAKYLGVTLDSSLSFNDHISNICKKANATRAFVHRNTKHCPQHVKVAAYNTLVRPTLEYCAPIWDPYKECHIDQIQAIQRRAARSVMRDWTVGAPHEPPRPTRGSPTLMQKQLKWTPLAERRARSKIILFYKIIKNHVDISTSILQKNNRNTRHNQNQYFVIQTRISPYRYSFFPSTILMWNKLPTAVVCAPSVDALRSQLCARKLRSAIF